MRATPAARKKSENKNAQAGNAQTTAYDYLKERILSGALRGGTPISPAETGKLLGLSRMPVREALLQLEADGLVRFGGNRRPIVTELTPKEIMELFEIRIALEQLAVARAVTRLTAADLADLSLHLARMDRTRSHPHAWLELHDEFHDRVYFAAGMPKLMQEIARLRESIRPYLLMYTSFFEQPEIPGCEHSLLVEVFGKRDSAAAQLAIARHIRTGASYLVYFLMNNEAPSHPERFDSRFLTDAAQSGRGTKCSRVHDASFPRSSISAPVKGRNDNRTT